MRWYKRIKAISCLPMLLSYLAKLYVLFIWGTSKVKYNISPAAEELLKSNLPCIISLWHSHIFVMPYFMKRFGHFKAVVSSHKDGIYLAQYLKRFGHQAILGSSNRQAFSAIRGVLRALSSGERVAITPDGPRGPRFQVAGNIVAIAMKTKMPIVILSFASDRKLILNTWDRFMIPLPFSKIYVQITDPIIFSDSSSKENVALLQQKMLEQAEHKIM